MGTGEEHGLDTVEGRGALQRAGDGAFDDLHPVRPAIALARLGDHPDIWDWRPRPCGG
ncbi:hypothetical protein ABZ078_07385 [Streptomyces sp. NPDC006385]|uniref:hypothetical protein n=1 Tax=Streptomyces sp. NPDC006385 TaxID=3156761 RepID=UPI0033A8985D